MNARHIDKSPGALRAFRDALTTDGLPESAAARIVDLISAMTVSDEQLATALADHDTRVSAQLHDLRKELNNDLGRVQREISREVGALKVNQAGFVIKVAGTLLTLASALVAFLVGLVKAARIIGLLP